MSSDHTSQKLKDLLKLLDKKNGEPTNGELELHFFNSVLEYLLSDSSDHWWCSETELPIAQESLWLFSLPDHENINKYKERLSLQLRSCTRCLHNYYTSKPVLRERYISVFSAGNVHSFFDTLDRFDRHRVMTSLRRDAYIQREQHTSKPQSLSDTIICAVYDILYAPHLLRQIDCDQLFCNLFDKMHASAVFPSVNTDVANGVVLLAYHHHRIVRSWARKLLDRLATDHFVLEDPDTNVQRTPEYYSNPPPDFVTDTIKLTSDISERSKAFRATINLLGPSQLNSIMSSTTASVQKWMEFQFLALEGNGGGGDGNNIQEMIRIMTILLQKLGRNFWGEEVSDVEAHHRFIKRVCEVGSFHTFMKIARASNTGKILNRDGTVCPEDKLVGRIKGMLNWIYFYWSALPEDAQDKTADSVLNILWGYFQLDSWSIICKACCAELGFKVVEDSLARDKCPYEKLNEFASIAVWFASIPSTHLPQMFRHIPDLAARVLTQVVRQDALGIRERIIAMSQTIGDQDLEKYQEQKKLLLTPHVGLQPVWQAISDTYKHVNGIEPRLILMAIEGYSQLVIVDLPVSNPKHPLHTSNKGIAMMKQVSTIRHILAEILRNATASTSAANIHERLMLYERLETISSVLPLTCSPYADEIQNPIMQLLSVPETNDKNQQQYTFRRFVDRQPQIVLEGFSGILDDFNNFAMALVALDSFKLVAPLNQTLSHLIKAIVGDDDSYILQLVVMGDYGAEEHRVIKQFWDTCWRTMGLIFGKAIEWSGTHKPKEVVSATIALFDTAQIMIDSRQVFQKAVDSSAPVNPDLSSFNDTSQLQYDHVTQAFDSLSQWITVTRLDVLQKLIPLITSILICLQEVNVRIPDSCFKHLKSATTGAQHTRLSDADKKVLSNALAPHQSEDIFLDDSDEDEEWHLVEPTHFTSPPSPNFSSHQQSFSPSLSSPIPPKITSYFSKTKDMVLDDAEVDDMTLDDLSLNDQLAPTSLSTIEHVDLTNNNDDDEFMDEFDELDISALPDEWFEGAITAPTSISMSRKQESDKITTASTSTNQSSKKSSIAAAIQAQQTELWKQHEQQKAKELLSEQQRQRQQQQWTTTFQPKTQKSNVYAVTSTGRKLRAPPTGFSKLKALRSEFKAENKLYAATKSASAYASTRNRNNSNRSNGGNSDSSSDSSDEDDDDGLQGLVNDMNESSKNKRAVPTEEHMVKRANEERASMKTLFEKPVKRSTKMIETTATQAFLEKRQLMKRADQRRKKIKPDIDRFFRIILSWDITVTSEIPPGAYTDMYKRVADTFNTYEEYLMNFEPLLLLEVWMQLSRARSTLTENDIIDRCILDSRCHVNDFVDVTFGVPLNSVNSLIVDDFVCVANHFGNEFFQRNEVDFINTEPLQKPTSWKGRCFLGRVVTVTQKKSISEVTLRCFFSPERIILLNSLSPKTSWRMLKLTSITTSQREYAALQGLEHYDLAQHIMNPKPYRMPIFTDHMVNRCIEKYGVNDPQARAILGALDKKRGFTLIQGPPGTGKTKTILGLIVSLLDEQMDRKRQKERGIRIDTESSEYTGESKILVCAPSNAAVDEIAKRLQDGVMTSHGLSKPKVVRIGTAESANISVREILLDRLVEKELAPTIGDTEETKNFGERRSKLNEDIRKVQLDIDDVEREIAECKGAESMMRLTELKEKRKTCVAQRNKFKYMIKGILEAQRDFTREQELSRHRARQKVFANVDIVCATLSGSGHEMLTNMGLMFDTVVVDEAAQSVEISSLIPLKYDCKRCILVGDPNQLPPTVLSQMASKYSYEQSLFMRLQKNAPDNVYLLSIQYRMHPEVSQFPSKLFYSSRLLDGPDMEINTAAPWHSQQYFPPYRFYNVEEGMERTGYGKSIYNSAEAEAALVLVDMLANRLPNIKFAYRIGIITPYKQQLSHIKHRFEKRYGPRILDVIDFNTVDGFQGQEKDIIIFSCVRALSDRGIGFLADMRRMNVGLTRAKSSLFVLGHKRSLMKSEYWGDLVKDAVERESILDIRVPYFNYQLVSNRIPSNLFEKEIKPTAATRKLPIRSKAQRISIPRVDNTLIDSSSSTEKRSRSDSPILSTTTNNTSSSSNIHEDMPRIKKVRTSTSDSVVPRSIDRNDNPQPSVLPIIPGNQNIQQSVSKSDISLPPTTALSPSVFPDTRRIARNDSQISVLPITRSCSSSPNNSPSRDHHRSDGHLTPSKRPPPGYQHNRQEQSALPRRPAKMTRDQYRSRPPPQAFTGNRGGSLYIQKRRSPQSISSSLPTQNDGTVLNARDRVVLEHQAAKEAMREIRRNEQQRSVHNTNTRPKQPKKSFDDLLDDIHRHR